MARLPWDNPPLDPRGDKGNSGFLFALWLRDQGLNICPTTLLLEEERLRAVLGVQRSLLISGGGCTLHPAQVVCAEASELINDGGCARLPL